MVRAFKAWLVALIAVSAGSAALAEKLVALVIGNSNYALAPLANPKNDADGIAAALQRLQFEVTKRNDLNVRAFDEAIDAFMPKAQNADVALFFFSGHGVQIGGRGYLAPIDIKAESESSALRELVAIQEVVSRIENPHLDRRAPKPQHASPRPAQPRPHAIQHQQTSPPPPPAPHRR
jgi:uncharacterized caspase-like protein